MAVAAGAWIKGLREARGLSQSQFLELFPSKAKTGNTFVSHVENGRARIKAQHYHMWADGLTVPVRDFAKEMMKFYSPLTYELLLDEASAPPATPADP